MKKLKKITSLLLAVAICVLLPNVTSLTASAEEAKTYYIKFSVADNSWRYQEGTWKENTYHYDLAFLHEVIKDGDHVAIEGAGVPINFSVSLSSLTLVQGSSAVVSAKSIDTCYVLRDNVSAISGDVTTAYVYDNATCTFNNNVGTLNVLNDASRKATTLSANVSVVGTVNHLIGNDGVTTHYELYNFAAGKLSITNGAVKTDAAFFSKTPSATTQTSQTATDNSASADEYDDVPKTGESTLLFWLLGISAICFAGSYRLKKAH